MAAFFTFVVMLYKMNHDALQCSKILSKRVQVKSTDFSQQQNIFFDWHLYVTKWKSNHNADINFLFNRLASTFLALKPKHLSRKIWAEDVFHVLSKESSTGTLQW